MRIAAILAVAAVLAFAGIAVSQNINDRRPDAPPDGNRGKPPVSPLESVLDANSDGIIDSTEIANAATALNKLDKNGDGKLTNDEFRPQRPGGSRASR